MKQFMNIVGLAALLLIGSGSQAQPGRGAYANTYGSNITYQTFYNELQPYGNWISYPGYGYVWQPAMGAGFRPYETNGNWVSTVDGWAWVSDYNWGWAPFHYGRWLLDPAIGWVWVPGYDWAPAWVQWGRYNNNYGWAPLSPGINVGFGNGWRGSAGYWSFIPYNCIGRQNINRYVIRNNVQVNNITVINNYNSYNKKDYYHRGPDYKEVQTYTHTAIKPLPIAASSHPGKTKIDNRLEIYRPTVAANESNPKIAPAKVKTMDEVKAGTKANDPKIQNNPGKPVKGNNAEMAQPNPQSQNNIKMHNGARPQKVNGNNNGMMNPRPATQNAPLPKPKMNAGGVKPAPTTDQSIETNLPAPVKNNGFHPRNETIVKPNNNQPQQNVEVTKPPTPEPNMTRPVMPTERPEPNVRTVIHEPVVRQPQPPMPLNPQPHKNRVEPQRVEKPGKP